MKKKQKIKNKNKLNSKNKKTKTLKEKTLQNTYININEKVFLGMNNKYKNYLKKYIIFEENKRKDIHTLSCD